VIHRGASCEKRLSYFGSWRTLEEFYANSCGVREALRAERKITYTLTAHFSDVFSSANTGARCVRRNALATDVTLYKISDGRERDRNSD